MHLNKENFIYNLVNSGVLIYIPRNENQNTWHIQRNKLVAFPLYFDVNL